MFRYVKKTVKYVLIALCVSIFVLLIMPVLYLFELFHPFRFGRVMNSRIGEMGPGLDQFLRKKKLGLLPANTTYFFALYDKTANHQMARMFKRTDLNIITNWLYTRFYEFCTPVLTRTRFYVMTAGNFFQYRLYTGADATLSFTPEEETRGRAFLDSLGITEKDWFVCFHTRDPLYLKNWEPTKENTYHNFRNSDVSIYIDAARLINSRGGYVLRMGALVEKKFDGVHPRTIDYANQYRDDFLDMYLCAKCRFFFGDVSGLWTVIAMFDKPVVCANYTYSDIPCARRSFYITKKFYSERERRFLKYNELLKMGLVFVSSGHDYTKQGIRVVDNTPEEITALAAEALDIMDGKRRVNEETQKIFKGIFPPWHPGHDNNVIINSDFVKNNMELFS